MKRDYNSLLWRSQRRKVITRAGGICERCRERPGKHVHHLCYGTKVLGTEPLDWLQLVCVECHQRYHPHRTLWTRPPQRKKQAPKPPYQHKRGLPAAITNPAEDWYAFRRLLRGS